MADMSKRIAAGILWFLAAWYAGAWIALLLGVPEILGPIMGISAAAVFAGDPLGIIWVRPTPVVELPARVGEATEDSYAEAA
jgi:hypothetical protein